MRVAVAGGTGLVGRLVVEALERDGHEVAVLARSRGVDVVSGRGLDEALAGAGAVVDCTNRETLKGDVATRFFVGGTENLVAAGHRAGVGHHVVLSIVGVDRVRTGYYSAKLAQEQAARAGAVPVTVVRATQFHEFAGQWLARARGPVVVVPRMRTRPVAAAEVADVLAEVATGAPQGALEVAGPQEHDLVDLVRRTARARGDRRPVLPVRLPFGASRAVAGGGLLPAGPARVGEQAFEQFLAGG